MIEVRAYRDGQALFIEPKVLVPMEVSRFKDVGRRKTESSPWITDGRVWHLEKRCSLATKDMLLALEGVIDELVEADGPFWDQKHYVAFRLNNFNWLKINTRPTMLILDFHVDRGTFQGEAVANSLGLVLYDVDEDLSEKLNLASSLLWVGGLTRVAAIDRPL